MHEFIEISDDLVVDKICSHRIEIEPYSLRLCIVPLTVNLIVFPMSLDFFSVGHWRIVSNS